MEDVMEDEYAAAFVGKKITKVISKVDTDPRIFGAVYSLTFTFDDDSQHTITAEPTGIGNAALYLDYVETD